MKIYTKTGDSGETSLFAGGRVSKNHLRIHTYGTVDELNSILGLAVAFGEEADIQGRLQRVQNELFQLGSDLATPLDAKAEWIVRMDNAPIQRLEEEIDSLEQELEPLTNFILPGGTACAAHLHQARTVCRRAERWLVALNENEKTNELSLQYLNRLSDWLFVIARLANSRANIADIVWQSR